ncbi:MAG TPA: substrate-binding domain-containing protein [Candidatus Enterocloster faecavium]|uniref:Ribokinase n=1 Tax=Candidatus Enterocloster faecavium TaxID=2838560 RepID=A0A9D2L7B5_9FIRM|nr:substrate-binding domain-containing protein [Candidatus Enterocloster faecavium]
MVSLDELLPQAVSPRHRLATSNALIFLLIIFLLFIAGQETRERGLKLVKEFNYIPYSGVSAYTAPNPYIIGVLIRSAGTNLSLNGIISAAREAGYTVLVAESAGQEKLELRGISAFCRHNVSGVLWEPLTPESTRYAEQLRSYGIPFLYFDSDSIKDALNIDYEQMGYDASMALVQSRHTDIACLLTPGTRTERFFSGYRRCLFESGIPYQENLVFREISDNLIHKITSQTITGIVSSHFKTSLELYRNLDTLHYQIPQDVSLVSLRDDSRDLTAFPEISTLTIPHFRFGRHICTQLVSLMENPEYSLLPFQERPPLDHNSSIGIPCTKRTQSIIVVGSINIDTYLKMDQLPSTGKSTITTSSAVYPGGKGVNQAIGATRLGAHVILIGAVGSDVDADLIYSSLHAQGIDTGAVRCCSDNVTGKAYIFVQKNGDSLISILAGANAALSPEDIQNNRRYFKNGRFCLVQTEIPQTTVLAACRTARSCGVSTILKPSACSSLEPELLQYVDILVPNLNEISLLCPEGTLEEKAGYFLSQGAGTVIVTLGADGCYVKSRDWEEYIPAVNFKAVDNTGACDAFISALAVYLQKGRSLQQAVQIATYAAAFSITREGVSPSLIDQRSLEAYLHQEAPQLLE